MILGLTLVDAKAMVNCSLALAKQVEKHSEQIAGSRLPTQAQEPMFMNTASKQHDRYITHL
jgi:hypothetical protein